MKMLPVAYRFILERKLALPALLFFINLACAISAFHARDWKRGFYWISSAVCIAMVSI
jgi:hypothetical protein